jgi:hypothetical protein
VAYAFVQDIASTWEQYKRVRASLVEPAPVGLMLHVAGPTEEGFRVIDVWESEEAWQRFLTERLDPAIAALGGPLYEREGPGRTRRLHDRARRSDAGRARRRARALVAGYDGVAAQWEVS